MSRSVSFRVSDEDYESMHKVKEKLGCSIKELYTESLFHFLVEHKDEVTAGMRQHFYAVKKRKKQKQSFFFKNAMVRLYKMVEWQYRLYGDVNHEQVREMIDLEMESFEFLDEDVKKALEKQAKHFSELRDERVYDTYVTETMPLQITNRRTAKWKKKKQ